MNEENKLVWKNYGDVNPLEYGGLFIAEDIDDPECFHVVDIRRIETESYRDDEDALFLIQEGFIDLFPDWYDIEDVAKTMGTNIDSYKDDPPLLVVDLWWYYGSQEFADGYSGTGRTVEGESIVRKQLSKMGIEV